MAENQGDPTEIDEAVMDFAVNWLIGAPNKKCAVCGSENLSFANHLVKPTVDSSDTQFMLICGNCATTYYINAAIMGLKSAS
jgi:hypothetical protein